MNTEGFGSARAHLDAARRVVQLLLARHIARHWPRLLSAAGTLSDVFVSVPEVRAALLPDRTPSAPGEAGLPDLDSAERALEAAVGEVAARVSATHGDLPVENLRALFALDAVELTTVLVVHAIQTDPTTARLATFAWADFTQKQPSLGFLAELVSPDELDLLLALASPAHRLRTSRLLDVARSPDLPAAQRAVRVPERVAEYLRGESPRLVAEAAPPYLSDGLEAWCSLRSPVDPADTTLDPTLISEAMAAVRHAHREARRGELGGPVVALTGTSLDDALDLTRVLSDRPALVIDLAAAHARTPLQEERVDEVLGVSLREATLLGAQPVVMVGDLQREACFGWVAAALRRHLSGRDASFVVAPDLGRALAGAFGPVPEVAVAPGAPPARLRVWHRALELRGASTPNVDVHLERVVDELAHRHALSGHAIREAARAARARAALRRAVDPKAPAGLSPQDVLAAIRGQVQHRLGTIAEPFSTQLTWDDFSAPPELRERLDEVVSWARHHRQVHETWGFGKITGYGRGLSVLLAGPPGTGKTFAAALIAKDLGAELYRVDLSRTVDKYIGETEKNLARLFDEAERSGAIILFDEADSLFSKRTQVTSSNDRYANLEVNFLLQRMEHFEGTTLLTTNFAENLDDAFKRRIKFRLTFRMPTPAERAALWRGMLPAEAPREAGIDFDRLGREFELAPAYIKNCVVRAAFRAAQLGRHLDEELLRTAARSEYQELGRVVRADTW